MDYYEFTRNYGAVRLPDPKKLLQIIGKTCRRISSKRMSASRLMPAEEWITDNYYTLKETADTLSGHGNKDRRSAYRTALFIVLNTEGRTDRESIVRETDAYQEYHALTLPELAALPDMLRLALLERLAFLCDQTEKIAAERAQAENFYQKYSTFLQQGDREKPQVRELDGLFQSIGDLTPNFTESLLRTASAVDSDTTFLREGLSRHLAGGGLSVQSLIEGAHRIQIRLGAETGNCIRSLSLLRSLCMEEILSRLNRVEQLLLRDPAGVFSRMSRDTRDAYVRQIYWNARKNGRTPVSETLNVLEKAEEKHCHVGFVIPGLTPEMPRRMRFPVALTLTGIALGLLVPVAGPCLFLLFVLAGETYRCIRTRRMRASVVPSMDFSGIIPTDISVMLVIPSLIPDAQRARELFRQLTCMIPAGRSENLYCTLIGDLPAHTEPEKEGDDALLQEIRTACDAANREHGAEKTHYFLYMRPRTYCKTENCYTGRERKRGALLDFGNFLKQEMENGHLPEIRYVITVDADSILTYSAMVRLVEQMEHPLNMPVVDDSGVLPIVRSGHALLAPSAAIYSADTETTAFSRLLGGENGFSGYGGRTSEYYFDTTGCGIYSGKGIYRPEIYRILLEKPFAPESLLSHDLIEGAFLRAGFSSDVKLYETLPRDSVGYLKRMHRWVRGDWQLLPYLQKSFRNRDGVLCRNPIPEPYSRIMKGNLRGSAAPIAAFLLLIGGMLLLPRFWYLWGLVFAAYVFREVWMNPCAETAKRSFLELLMLPEKAVVCADAIVRTLYRLRISRKHLLSWVTARDSEKKGGGIFFYYKNMAVTFFSGLLLFGLLFRLPFAAIFPFLTLGALWMVAPALFYKFGLPEKQKRNIPLSPEKRAEITVVARKIWAYYEDYAAETDHFLPPDNVQFKPVYAVAHRTSPTNIGFMMTATAIAAELGFGSAADACERLHAVMDTLDVLEKWNGHLYNWYDTVSLAPLEPRFVSSVDSGNLAACMLTACGILQLLAEKQRQEGDAERLGRYFKGYRALCDCIAESSEVGGKIRRSEADAFERLLRERPNDRNALFGAWRRMMQFTKEQTVPRRHEKPDTAIYRDKLLRFCTCFAEPTEFLKESSRIPELVRRCRKFCREMDFSCLFNREKGLFSIGYHVREGKLSESHYDICVSEARLMSAVAAAKGDVPEEHFARMSRKRGMEGRGVLQSWSGTAFEYLMPDLFLQAPPGSLWDETVRMMLDIQAEEGRKRGIPWGVSESCYNVMDLNMNYKYKAFGVPALSVRGRAEAESVAAPYASLMAIARMPGTVLRNLERFRTDGAWGTYGYYESVDYTKGRRGVVSCYMAHHLGMSLCGIANLLSDYLVRRGMQEGAEMRALDIYAQERKPENYGRRIRVRAAGLPAVRFERDGKSKNALTEELPEIREFTAGGGAVNLLSNGRYTVATDDTGGGLSAYGNLLLTKYSEQTTVRHEGGARLFIGNARGERIRDGVFYPEKTVYRKQTELGAAEEEICVCAEDDTEIRLLRFTECSDSGSTCHPDGKTVTAFCELMLNSKEAYWAHPAFSDLFLVTDALYEDGNLLGLMARRNAEYPEEECCAFFGLFTDGELAESTEFDTDLSLVYGRNWEGAVPEAVYNARPLSGTKGAAVTPCFAIRKTLTGNARHAWLCMGIAGNERICRERLLKYRELARARGAFETARTRTLVEKEHIGLRPGEWRYFMDLAGSLLVRGALQGESSNPDLVRLMNETERDIRQKLYAFGVSGNRPLITVMMRRIENSGALEKMVRFWCMLSFRAFPTDLVIVAFDDGSYLSPIRELADRLAQRALSGAFGVRGELVVVVPGDHKTVQPLLAASHLVFWM